MNAIAREIADPSPIEAVRAAEQAAIEAHNAANAATLALTEAERALGGAEKELNALQRRPIFDKPRKEELDAAMVKVMETRKSRDDAREALAKAKTLHSWRGQEVAKARREAFEPAKAAAISRLVEIARRADRKRAELAEMGAEFDAVAADLQAAIVAGAQGRPHIGFRFANIVSADALRAEMRNLFGAAV